MWRVVVELYAFLTLAFYECVLHQATAGLIVRNASPDNVELGGLESCSERSAEEVGFFVLPGIEPH